MKNITDSKISPSTFQGCIIGGAIGDAWGSSYEFEPVKSTSLTYMWGNAPIKEIKREWQLTDDTQLTLATCECLSEESYSPGNLAKRFLSYYKQKKLSGIGASTLKALRDLEIGISWRQSGRTGEYAAGNGCAMRIAPFAFFPAITREDIYDACRITHRNDEAYAGALAVYLALRSVINKEWNGRNNLFEILIDQLPDTKVRDRLIEMNQLPANLSIAEIANLGNNGYVVNSVPFALYSASKVCETGISNMFQEVIHAGGDTDTNASIAGQIAGCLLGVENIPAELTTRLYSMEEYEWLKGIMEKTLARIE